jgi:hypothetical protein
MDNRGSNSVLLQQKTITVKEQRVDGSWSIKAITKKMLLRYTLMGLERNYQVKIPSKQLNNIRYYSSNSHSTLRVPSIYTFTPLNPYFVTGFSYAEASFIITHPTKWGGEF